MHDSLTVSSFAGSVPSGSSVRRAVVLAGVLGGSLWLAGCGQQAGAQGGPPQAAPVSVSPAVQRPVFDSEEFSGRLEATEFVELRPRVGGVIDKVHFTDGAMVSKGQLLFTIDPRPFQAEVARPKPSAWPPWRAPSWQE